MAGWGIEDEIGGFPGWQFGDAVAAPAESELNECRLSAFIMPEIRTATAIREIREATYRPEIREATLCR